MLITEQQIAVNSTEDRPKGSGGVRHRPRPSLVGVRHGIALRAIDVAALALTMALAFEVVHLPATKLFTWGRVQELLTILLIAVVLVFGRLGMYRRSFATTARDEVYATFAAILFAAIPTTIIVALVPPLWPEWRFFAAAFVIGAFVLGTSRYVAHATRMKLFPPQARNIVIVGSPDRVASIPGELALTAEDLVQRFYVDDFDEEVEQAIQRREITNLQWLRSAIECGAREIIVTEALPPNHMSDLLRVTEAAGIRLAFAPTRIRPNACQYDIHRDGGLALLYPRSLTICGRGADTWKRVFDVTLAATALVILAVPMVVVAIAVYLDSGRPILYRQERVGRHGKTFQVYKFRTMRNDAEAAGPVWSRSGENRTTRVGRVLRRLSLDELPQLLNVLRGDMSLVGPRPERPFYVEQFKKILPRYDERHLVRPGLTGWAQISMHRLVDTSAIGERLAYDIFYLEHWSVFMDLLIICKTAAEFLFHSTV